MTKHYLFIYALFASTAFVLLHVDGGSGVFSKMGQRWLYVTYEFYFEPIYSSMHPAIYLSIMWSIFIHIPMIVKFGRPKKDGRSRIS